MPPSISVCIMARDEAAKIHHSLQSAHACSWCDELLGCHVRAWDPDRIRRLFRRNQSAHQPHRVHDSRTPLQGSLGRLAAPILHNAQSDDFGDYFDGAGYQITHTTPQPNHQPMTTLSSPPTSP